MTAQTIERVNVLGVGVSAVDPAQAAATIGGWIERRENRYVCCCGVHGVIECQRDAELRRIHNRAGLVVPDGMPLVWISRYRGHREVRRVYGPDLMLDLFDRSQANGWRHFLYGGVDDAALELLSRRLAERFPRAEVVGAHSPPFRPPTPAEDAAVVRQINDSGADLVWVGLGAPKQERWMAEHLGRLDAAALLGVGAAFDFHAGRKPQAPRWMQRSGLEWFYRMLSEPRRLGPRYLVNNPLFVWKLLLQETGLGRWELEPWEAD